LTKAIAIASVQPKSRNPHKKAAALLQMPENVLLVAARQKTPGQPEH